jgi:hypothetical protein
MYIPQFLINAAFLMRLSSFPKENPGIFTQLNSVGFSPRSGLANEA